MIHVYPAKDVLYNSAFSIAESVSRLSSKVRNNRFGERLVGGVFGTVSPDKVFLWYRHPFRLFAGLLVFKGSFSQKNGAVNLAGRFEIFHKACANSWLTAAILLFCFPYFFELSEPAGTTILTFAVFNLFLWLLLLFLSYRRGKIDDINKISETIEDALHDEALR